MNLCDFVTVRVGDHLFGINASVVQDVFNPRNITPAPLAPDEVLGLLNLRGRIVTAISARRRLGLQGAGDHDPKAVGIETPGDSYGLVVDKVEAVVKLDPGAMIAAPDNLPPRWADIILGVFRTPDELLVVLDAVKLLTGAGAKGVAA